MQKNSIFLHLQSWGWSEFFENKRIEKNIAHEDIERVIGVERDWYRVAGSFEANAQISGKFRHRGLPFPAVGDWVVVSRDQHGTTLIEDVFERVSTLERKNPGETFRSQVLAANFNYAFVATSLNSDYSLNRVERFLTAIWNTGAQPVVLLTKSDLVGNLEDYLEEARQRLSGVAIFGISAKDASTIEPLREYVKEGMTVVIVGSSGVGKSTLTNLLVGEEVLKTQEAREGDDKGRHTTTSRSLVRSQLGGLIIDSPGVREFQLLDQEEGLETLFEDIAALANACRFTDCQHRTEPGCRILDSLDSGELSEERWESYQKMMREIRFVQRKTNKAIASEDKKIWKRRSLAARSKRP